MNEGTLDAVFLGPIGNNQGRFFALNLKTGHQIKHTHPTILPATDIAIDRVHAMATKEKMSNGLIFGDRAWNTTILDLNLTSNTEDNDASDDDFSIESDFEDISLPDTIVKDNDDELQDIAPDNYYDAIAFHDNSDYEQNNEENEINQVTVNSNTNTNNTVIKPDPDANKGESIPETDISTDEPHSTNNDTTNMNNAGEEYTIPDMIGKLLANEEVPYAPAAHI